jgi:NAD(P)-dependent dehydrogenase (short-subunit alcohol dehydrogenase family)
MAQVAFSKKTAENLLRLFSSERRTALVTGGASGLGKRMGTVLAATGAKVYFGDINEEGARTAAEEFKAVGTGGTHAVFLDVTDPKSVKAAFDRIKRDAGGVDILVCSAGMSKAKWIEDMSLDIWRMVLEVNLPARFSVARRLRNP